MTPIIGDLIESTIGKAVDKALSYIPDPEQRAKAEAELRADLMKWDAGQMTVNAAEAANTSLFVAGWRPFIGWVCGAALLYTYILVPLGSYLMFAFGHLPPKLPMLDDHLFELMFGMLGMAGWRTLDKIKGVSK